MGKPSPISETARLFPRSMSSDQAEPGPPGFWKPCTPASTFSQNKTYVRSSNKSSIIKRKDCQKARGYPSGTEGWLHSGVYLSDHRSPADGGGPSHGAAP